MSKVSFPYPLPEHALASFCHPAESSEFYAPRQVGRETLVANGHLALRITRGQWLDSSIAPASAEFVARLDGLNWNAPFALPDWNHLQEAAGRIFKSAPQGLWLNGRTGPSPVVMVAGRFRARLSVLQLVARLPRCEIHTGPTDASAPLWLRFSGGVGLIAHDRRLDGEAPAFAIFEPIRDCLTGERVERRKTPPQRLEQPGRNWPPVDLTDTESEAQTSFTD